MNETPAPGSDQGTSPHTLHARLVVRLYADDRCVGASDDPGVWNAVLTLLMDEQCQRLEAAAEPLDAGEEEG